MYCSPPAEGVQRGRQTLRSTESGGQLPPPLLSTTAEQKLTILLAWSIPSIAQLHVPPANAAQPQRTSLDSRPVDVPVDRSIRIAEKARSAPEWRSLVLGSSKGKLTRSSRDLCDSKSKGENEVSVGLEEVRARVWESAPSSKGRDAVGEWTYGGDDRRRVLHEVARPAGATRARRGKRGRLPRPPHCRGRWRS